MSDAWSLTSLRFSYKWALSLFGGSSRGAQLLVHRRTVVRREDLVLFHRARSFGRDTHGPVREEGDTRLASQISRINPSDQWGDRCRSQIALTSIRKSIPRLLIKPPHKSWSSVMVLVPIMPCENTNRVSLVRTDQSRCSVYFFFLELKRYIRRAVKTVNFSPKQEWWRQGIEPKILNAICDNSYSCYWILCCLFRAFRKDATMAEKVILHYFNGRGKMESIRWLLAVAGVEVKDYVLTD